MARDERNVHQQLTSLQGTSLKLLTLKSPHQSECCISRYWLPQPTMPVCGDGLKNITVGTHVAIMNVGAYAKLSMSPTKADKRTSFAGRLFFMPKQLLCSALPLSIAAPPATPTSVGRNPKWSIIAMFTYTAVQRPPTPLLDTINYPIHMKNLSIKELKQLADEVRSDVIFNVSKTGRHLGSSLGVVELTMALHYVFNTPQDKILWDVGH
ncbi:hypothetical protein M8C21_010610 [Ambrosia artemisiifolia]|uniref:1-deoxy-D-xylulose-5-phosphate synthase n=1 Tax=Ambrosia artemisiifolia TaxID=4212 RepID=A0AAD5GK18_AMBAR|nr:hypothetical protein M8C21_010610 [Ambrosia artemisiifolia]